MLLIIRLRMMLSRWRSVALSQARHRGPCTGFRRLWRASRAPRTRVRWAGIWACPVTWVILEVQCVIEIALYVLLCRFWCQEAIGAACYWNDWVWLSIIVAILTLCSWLLWWKVVFLRFRRGYHHLNGVVQRLFKWLITNIFRLFINIWLKGTVLFKIWLALLF